VPEVIEHGRTGVIVEDHAEMASVLEQADGIDPMECRRYVEERFSKERMVADYEAAYEKAVETASTSVS
jgi:glycosyltransferase involved in cell wall biosynthesis